MLNLEHSFKVKNDFSSDEALIRNGGMFSSDKRQRDGDSCLTALCLAKPMYGLHDIPIIFLLRLMSSILNILIRQA